MKTKAPIRIDWMTYQQAADRLGVTRQRVHAIAEAYEWDIAAVSPRLHLVRRGDVVKYAREVQGRKIS